MFNRAFIFMQTNTVFAAYNIYVIDAQSYKLIAKSGSDLQTRVHGIHITWHKGYAGVTSSTLKAIKSTLQKQLPPSLTHSLRKIGMP